MWKIRDWDRFYENAESRRVESTRWVPVPSKQDGDGYLTLVDSRNGPALYGAFVAVVLVASKCSPRGTLVQSNGLPHTAETIARKSHLPANLIQECLSRCSDASIGWVEWVETQDQAGGLFPDGPGDGSGLARSRLVADSQPAGTASTGNGSGNGRLLPQPPPRGDSGEGSEKPEDKPRGITFRCCDPDEAWYVPGDHLDVLIGQWPDLRVEDCLRELAQRQEHEPELRRTASKLPKFLQNWLATESKKVRKFLRTPERIELAADVKRINGRRLNPEAEQLAAQIGGGR